MDIVIIVEFAREKLSLEDIELEAKAIAETGLEQVLVLTGESKSCSPPSYIQLP